MTKRNFGRRVVPDARDAAHPMLTVSHAQQAAIRRKLWTAHKALDQGDTPQCVAYSAEGYLLARPVVNREYKTPAALYGECQAIDGIPGPHDGSTVRAAFAVLKRQGYVSEYRWAQSVADVTGHLLGHGPVVLGVDWYAHMMDTDAQGFIHATGPLQGGHAILARGCDLDKPCPDGSKGAVMLRNSWNGWGVKHSGDAWLSVHDLAKLLAASGEAAEATEVKLP